MAETRSPDSTQPASSSSVRTAQEPTGCRKTVQTISAGRLQGGNVEWHELNWWPRGRKTTTMEPSGARTEAARLVHSKHAGSSISHVQNPPHRRVGLPGRRARIDPGPGWPGNRSRG